MLVQDRGDAYQLVLQPDHGELAGQIACAWSPPEGLSARTRAALIVAAARHDDGWSVWERHPRLDDEGRPHTFLSVPLAPLLSSYVACVDVLADVDPLAGLLVSMHVSGLRRGRYGVMGEEVPEIDQLDPPVAEFVRSEERRQARMTAELEVPDTERWEAYRLLQVFDVLALQLGLRDPAEAEVDPSSLASTPVELRLRRRLVPKRAWASDAEFQADFAAAPAEEVPIRLG